MNKRGKSLINAIKDFILYILIGIICLVVALGIVGLGQLIGGVLR